MSEMSGNKVLAGFGLGPIQVGLFLYEAQRTGRFDRFVISEVNPQLRKAVRENNGQICVNIATTSGIQHAYVRDVEVYDPNDSAERTAFLEALGTASEITTALPNINIYNAGKYPPAMLLAQAIMQKNNKERPSPAVIYTAENNNYAAEELAKSVADYLPEDKPLSSFPVQFLNTVIGKMSGMIESDQEIRNQGLTPVTPGTTAAYLVETFNQIQISTIQLPGFDRGIAVFEEKPDLIPFEELKLYGHNAVHALFGYLAHLRGYSKMADITDDAPLLEFGRRAFFDESGPALINKYSYTGDDRFTTSGFAAYAEDLLQRMLNPYLGDSVDRIIRDTPRKLGWNDRLIGTIRLIRNQGICPRRFAVASAAALKIYGASDSQAALEKQIHEIWAPDTPEPEESQAVAELVLDALDKISTDLTAVLDRC